MALTKEVFTGEKYLNDQLETLRKYIYNVAQRHIEEHKEQRIQGIEQAIRTMTSLVEEIVRRRNKECETLNAKYGGR